jgi:hypothetical protein
VKTISLQAIQFDNKHTFGSECQFATDNSILAAKADSLQTTKLQQRTLIRCRQCTFSSEHKFTADNTISAAKADLLKTT